MTIYFLHIVLELGIYFDLPIFCSAVRYLMYKTVQCCSFAVVATVDTYIEAF